MSRPRLACLVVTRDDADRLPAWLAAVRPLADAILALDEGSSDGSIALLAREPLVRTLLHAEPSGAGTHAPAVNRLLDAAARPEPEWLLWLDVAERVAPSDVEALRDFLARDALPGLAYGLQRDGGGVAFRLFAYADGHRLSADASDDAMVPAAIPRARWMATTLTLERVTGSGPARSRLAGAPVLVPRDGSPGAADGPVISAVVVARDDDERIEPVVHSLVEQDCPDPFELIVVTSGSGRAAAIVRERFPGVEVVELTRAGVAGAARNAGLARARGDYVTFLGAQLSPHQGSLAASVRAHDRGHPVVTGRPSTGRRRGPAGLRTSSITRRCSRAGRRARSTTPRRTARTSARRSWRSAGSRRTRTPPPSWSSRAAATAPTTRRTSGSSTRVAAIRPAGSCATGSGVGGRRL